MTKVTSAARFSPRKLFEAAVDACFHENFGATGEDRADDGAKDALARRQLGRKDYPDVLAASQYPAQRPRFGLRLRWQA